MAETISHTWQTVEQAAVTLNVSTRTIARRLANGSLESRVDENGRRLVLVQQINPAAVAEEAFDAGVEESALAPVEASPTPVVASSQAITMLNVLQSTVTAAREDAGRARRSAKWAWAGVAAMALALFAGAAVVSSLLTRGVVTTGLLREQLAETKVQLQQTQNELIATRSDKAVTARDLDETRKNLEAARRPVLVAAPSAPAAPPAVVPTAARPTTRPTSIVDRVVSIFGQ